MAHGSIHGVPLGAHFSNRRSLYVSGVHRDIRRGICGSAIPGHGAESVVLSGGYEDDIDLGDVVYYTGQGGRDSAGIQIGDQTMQGLNASLARNVDAEQPVRLIRATSSGLRYDGLYLVEDAWLAAGKRGHLVCKYRLRSQTALATVVDRPHTEPVADPATAPRRQVTHYQLVRDGAVPTRVKSLYDNACQICGVRLEIAAGAYAEGAHLVPLGGGQDGADHLSNILCLCPNHHVLLDHGAIALTDDWCVIDRQGRQIGVLTVHERHPLNPTYARRHRQLLGFPNPTS
jgi:putative restriction endonuclease